MKRLQHALRRFLSAGGAPVSIETLWRQQRVALSRSMLLVRVFYVCLLFILLQNYPSWGSWLATTKLRALWPVAWMQWTGMRAGVGIVITLSIAGALLAAAWPGVRWLRVLAAVGVLEFAAFFSSFGVVNHGWHVFVWIAAIFVLLPDGSPDRVGACVARRQRYLRVFWSAQGAMLMFYSMSGMTKLLGAAVQMHNGLHHAFSSDGLARHIAYRLQEGSSRGDSILGPIILQHPILGTPLYMGAIYLEVFSLLVVFRPRLLRAWGVGLIAMHIGIYLTLTIMFSWQILAVGLLIVCSPFAAEQVSVRDVLRDLPVVGDIWWWNKSIRATKKPVARGVAIDPWEDVELERLA